MRRSSGLEAATMNLEVKTVRQGDQIGRIFAPQNDGLHWSALKNTQVAQFWEYFFQRKKCMNFDKKKLLG
jgi:hypothetical protein